MRNFTQFSSLLLLLFITKSAFTQTTINGTIVDKKGKPIPLANAFLKISMEGAVSDESGKFQIIINKIGPDTLVINALGFDAFSFPIKLENKVIDQTFKIIEKETQLEEVVISAGTIEASNERSVAVLKPMDIVTTAGAQGDIIGAIQTLPGVQRNGGDQTGLMVRGGDVNESIMIIDGAIAQNAFNSNIPGVSQRSRFNPFQFKGTSFSSGGYSSRYGQALSAVLDLQTNDLPEKTTVNIGANMAGVYVSGSKLMENNSVDFSANYLNLSPFYAIVPTNVDYYKVPQGGNFSTRYISKLKDGKGIFKMNVSQGFNKTGVKIPSPAIGGDTINFNLGNENTYLNSSFNYKINSTSRFFSVVSVSNNSNTIEFGDFDIFNNDSRIQGRAEYRKDFTNRFTTLIGGEVQRISYLQKVDTLLGKFDEFQSAGYLEGEWKITRKIAVKPGVRGEYSQLIARGNVAPRLAFALKTGVNSQFSFAGGLFYQTASSQYLLQGYRPGFQESVHYMANYQVIKNDRTFRIEAYYKEYNKLIREHGVAYTPNQYRFNFGQLDNSGSGYAQGIDFFWRDKKTVKNLDYWISYSYIDTKRLYQNYISKVTPDYVSKNNLNVIVKYFVDKIQTNFSFSYNYASGRAYYNPNSSDFMNDFAPDFHNMALTVSYLTTIKKYFAVFYLSADNILGTKNILGYRYSNDGSQMYPILPPMYRSVFVGFNLSLSQFKQEEL